MSAYALQEISQLNHQLQLSPPRLRLKQLRGIDRALATIESDAGASYPYELVCFWITGFRPIRSGNGASLPGDELLPDLIRLADDLTRKTSVEASKLGEPYATQDELAGRFNVSTKTISRWRKRGLGGFRLDLSDGQKKLVFAESTVTRFATRHADLIQRAAAFTQLTPEEKANIIDRARALLSESRLKLHDVSQRIAAETGRAVETVRYTLRRHDRDNPDQAVFEPNGKPRVHPDHRKIYAAYQDGLPIDDIARMMGKSAGTVQRILYELRAREIHQRPIEFVHNDCFETDDADEQILDQASSPDQLPGTGRVPGNVHNANPYIRKLYETPLLTRDQEQALFRRYNYVKFKAHRLREQLDPINVDVSLLEKIEDLLRHADQVKNCLVKCNLRLVVNIAKRHVGSGDRFFEVISDGNTALMRAVEKFDYARGYKFSTYASWAVMKTYARTIPERQYYTRRFVTGQEELLLAAPDRSEPTGPLSHLHAVKEALALGWKVLTSREQNILKRHFGLYDCPKPQTLEQIGKAIGISKERVRQIEKQAMGKLQVALAPIKPDLMG